MAAVRQGAVVGVELVEPGARIVTLSAGGRVTGRGAASEDTATAVGAALAAAIGARDRVARCGVVAATTGDAADRVLPAGLLPRGVEPLRVQPAEALAAAESIQGAARGVPSFAVVWLGEHVLGSLVLDGRLWTGDHGLASSLGWMALNPVEREDYRRLGGLEADVAAAGIVRRFVWRIKSGDHSSVVDAVGGELGRTTVAHVLEGARAGDAVAVSVVRDTARYLGMAIANLVSLVDPSLVVLGGAVAAAGDLVLEGIRAECARRIRPALVDRVHLALSPLGGDALALGAALAAARRR